MKTLNVLYHLALADFFERTRRYRFLLTLAAIIYLGVLVNNGTVFFYLMSGDLSSLAFRFRGEFNSAWVGTMTVLVTNSFLGLFGFYLVIDCIERDIRTGVGQIIATTPVRRATYLIGKWISNFAVLSVLELILAASAAVMVLLKGEAALDLGALLMPFLAVGLPYMALIAALAVGFETVPWLRGALGNAVYFFLWIFLLMTVLVGGTLLAVVKDSMAAGEGVSASSVITQTGAIMELPTLKDPMGFNVFRESLSAGILAAYPNEQISLMGVQAGPAPQYRVFNWPGLTWTPGIVVGQWLWAVFGLGLILLSAVWFGRFDPSREGLRRWRGKPEEAKEGEPAAAGKKAPHITLPSLSPLVSKLAQVNPFLGVLFAELRLLLKGRRWWWWAVTAGLNIAILISPLSMAKQYLLPFAWLWPMAVWSGMGNRERKNNTSQMVFSSARPVLRQLPAAWLAGVLATAIISAAGAVVCLSNGDLPGLAGWVGAIIFIPALALALGVLSSGSRVFEVVYLIWWYIGPGQKTQGMDFTNGAPQVYLLAAVGLLLLSAFWRSRQVRV
jgi:ABC-type transport system involved in multi-copper enzyme maturation permease subunit